MARFAVPALILHGSSDGIPVGVARGLAQALPNARLEMLRVPGQFPMLEQPQAFPDAVRAFVLQETH